MKKIMNEWMRRKNLFPIVRYQQINVERMIEWEKSVFGKNHSNDSSCRNHEWMLKTIGWEFGEE